MELAGLETLKPERVQQGRVFALEDASDLTPDRDHLVAVVGVRGHVDVGEDLVEDGEVVGTEGASPARALLHVAPAAAPEALHAVGERRAPEVGETGLHAPARIRVDLEALA